jgi:hypothetical protein
VQKSAPTITPQTGVPARAAHIKHPAGHGVIKKLGGKSKACRISVSETPKQPNGLAGLWPVSLASDE